MVGAKCESGRRLTLNVGRAAEIQCDMLESAENSQIYGFFRYQFLKARIIARTASPAGSYFAAASAFFSAVAFASASL
jgi:hypothetical protein